MKKLLEKIKRILHDRRTRRRLTRIVSGLAAVVVFVTTYALVLPAITMEQIASCGIEEHEHNEECYEDVLVCEIPESQGHQHDDSCYAVSKMLVCAEEEHVHGDSCRNENGALICGKTEHTHTETCFKEVRELICGLDESEGHRHGSQCYKKVLSCGKKVHVHCAACFEKGNGANESSAAADSSFSGDGVTCGGSGTPESLNSGEYADSENMESGTGTAGDAAASNLTAGGANASDLTAGGAAASDTSPGDAAASDLTAGGANASALTAGGAAASDTSPGGAAASDITSGGATFYEGAVTGTDTGGEAVSGNMNAAGSSSIEGAADAYIPALKSVDFQMMLTQKTGIFHHTASGSETVEDSSSITDWTRVIDDTKEDERTILAPADLLRVYLSYMIPAGSLNASNPVARYRLPGNMKLTDEQIESINGTVNRYAGQYLNMESLEITDSAKYSKSLGMEAIEGSRLPGQDVNEYSDAPADSADREYISAIVRAENVFNEETGEYEGQDLVFSFTPYTIEKNEHTCDASGQQTRAGEQVEGWFAFDLRPDQIVWNNVTEKTIDKKDGTTVRRIEKDAEIVFSSAAQDGVNTTEEIKTTLRLAEETESGDVAKPSDTAAAKGQTSSKTAGNGEIGNETSGQGTAADKAVSANTAEKAAGVNEKTYPAISFTDKITVSAGKLESDQGAKPPADAKLTVNVEAEKCTFPAGTTMKLSEVTDEQMGTVAEAVDKVVEIKTIGFHAVDISFWDSKGNEIEPLKPIRVSMSADEIRRAVEDDSTAPVVVHVTDPAGDAGNASSASADSAASSDSHTSDDSEDNAASVISNQTADTTAAAVSDDSVSADSMNSAVSMESGDLMESSEEPHTAKQSKDTKESGSQTSGKNAAQSDAAQTDAVQTDAVDQGAGIKKENSLPEAALIEAVTGTEAADADIAFETAEFSVYAIVYTVSKTVLTADGETYKVTVTYGEEAGIPEGTELVVKSFNKDDDSYLSYRKNAEKWVETIEAESTVSHSEKSSEELSADDSEKSPEAPSGTVSEKSSEELSADDSEKSPEAPSGTVSEKSSEESSSDDSEVFSEVSSANLSEEQKQEIEEALGETEKSTKLTAYSLFDIALEYNGKEIEPTGTVSVTIEALNKDFWNNGADQVIVSHYIGSKDTDENTGSTAETSQSVGQSDSGEAVLQPVGQSDSAESVLQTVGQSDSGEAVLQTAGQSQSAGEHGVKSIGEDSVKAESVKEETADVILPREEPVLTDTSMPLTENGSVKVTFETDSFSLYDVAGVKWSENSGDVVYYALKHGMSDILSDSSNYMAVKFSDIQNLSETEYVNYIKTRSDYASTSPLVIYSASSSGGNEYNYAINGTLDGSGNANGAQIYETGDMVMWKTQNQIGWRMIRYQNDSGVFTGYYEFINIDTDKILSPSSTTVLSAGRKGVQLDGSSGYSSTIKAWDSGVNEY